MRGELHRIFASYPALVLIKCRLCPQRAAAWSRTTTQLFDIGLSRLDQMRWSGLVAAAHCISGAETPQVPGRQNGRESRGLLSVKILRAA